MKKSGLRDSPFFTPPVVPEPVSEDRPAKTTKNGVVEDNAAVTTAAQTGGSSLEDTMHDTMPPRYQNATVERIRRAVRTCGKEAATHRFTAGEKEAIAEIVYACKRRGLRTTENEIARIAVNFIVADHQARGEESLLTRVLLALNA